MVRIDKTSILLDIKNIMHSSNQMVRFLEANIKRRKVSFQRNAVKCDHLVIAES